VDEGYRQSIQNTIAVVQSQCDWNTMWYMPLDGTQLAQYGETSRNSPSVLVVVGILTFEPEYSYLLVAKRVSFLPHVNA